MADPFTVVVAAAQLSATSFLTRRTVSDAALALAGVLATISHLFTLPIA